MTTKQEAALQKARNYFEYANSHPSTIAFRKKAREDYGFYDGTGQWPAEVIAELSERGQSPVTVNKIKNLVNYMSGMEVQTRFRVAFRSHSGKGDDDKLSLAVSHLGYAIQENQDIPYKSSLKFRDTLVTGIGWSNLFKSPETGEINYEYVNPMNILFDPDDLSPNFENMSFVCRVRWISIEKAKDLWHKHASYFDSVFGGAEKGASAYGSYSGELEQRQHNSYDSYSNGSGEYNGNRVKIIEVQYKESKTSYIGIDKEGRSFQTFNEDEAIALSENKSDIVEKQASQTMRVMFTDDILLEYAPLQPNLPNMPDFTYIPCIWTRRFSDGVPDGWISVMKDIQREMNYRRTKLVHNLNSFRVIYDRGAVNLTEQQVAQIMKNPATAIAVNPGARFDIESNQSLAPGQFEMLNRGDQEMQQVSGIYDEALGKETNAQSGIAIQHRQINSVRNQVFAFDNLKMMKKREARMMLNLIQGSGEYCTESHILTDEEKETIILNLVRDVDGKKIVFNDIRTLPLSIYVEEVPDFESSVHEQQIVLEKLLSTPNAAMLMQSPQLLKRLGVRDYENLAQDVQGLFAQQQQEMVPSQIGVPEQAMQNQQPMGGM
ncbi:hypothetical protein [Cysteiniphilum marinum]|nr:hypothetical protein [Cysteiniphilum marinum]